MFREISSSIKLNICIFGFVVTCLLNLSIVEGEFDSTPLLLGGAMLLLFFLGNLLIRKMFYKGDKYIFVLAGLLSLIGIVMLYRLDVNVAKKQCVWMIIGVIVFLAIQIVIKDFAKFEKLRYVFLGATIVLMSMGVLFGTVINGASNWIKIGGFTIQPSELGKVMLILYLASALVNYGEDKRIKFIKGTIASLVEPAAVVMVSLGFMVLQRDLGSALIIFLISVTMLYLGTEKGKYVFATLVLFIMGSGLSYKLFGHVRKRIMIWQNPWEYGYSESFQIIQGLIGICTGGFFGTGLGLGNPQAVPFVKTDYIFAAICEEMGILVGIAILIIYFLIFYRGMRISIVIENKFMKLVMAGLSVMIASQTLVIIGGILGMIPLTGITLPLISYGGSSMLTVYISLALIQKISEVSE